MEERERETEHLRKKTNLEREIEGKETIGRRGKRGRKRDGLIYGEEEREEGDFRVKRERRNSIGERGTGRGRYG